MIRATAVIARLQTLVPDTLRSIGGASELANITEVLKFSKASYVFPRADEEVTPNDLATGATRQRVSRRFTVATGFVRVGQNNIENSLDDIDDTSEAIKNLLIGWTPDGEQAPVEYAGGGIIDADFNQGFVIWGNDFRCPYYVRAT